jgi:signal transduction histidine kinase
VDKARSRELGGTGLGLSIVKHIAESHRGSVSVSSVPGEGTVFRIQLPLRRP